MPWQKYHPPLEAADILANCKGLTIASTTDELIDLACGGPRSNSFVVSYELPDDGTVTEATVARVRNGVVANYPEPYMRRRDPDCMVIADDLPTDKPTFKGRYGYEFGSLREETLQWLAHQPLVAFGFVAGRKGLGADGLMIAPAN